MLTPALHQRLVDTVRLRGLSDRTADVYACAVRNFVRHAQACPADVGTEAIRAWLLHLRSEGYAAETLKSYRAAVAFLYEHVLHRPDELRDVPRPRAPRRDVVPALTRDEVHLLLASASDALDHAFFHLLYATGMRMGEACSVQVCHIDRRRHLLQIPLAKGGKARAVPLHDAILDVLTDYWRAVRPRKPWLFPSPRTNVAAGDVRDDPDARFRDRPIGTRSMGRRFIAMRQRAGLRRKATPHDLRRAYATHLHEQGVSLRAIQVLLGHERPETTTRYTAVSARMMRRTPCTLTQLPDTAG